VALLSIGKPKNRWGAGGNPRQQSREPVWRPK
jgi:hypothetical protein